MIVVVPVGAELFVWDGYPYGCDWLFLRGWVLLHTSTNQVSHEKMIQTNALHVVSDSDSDVDKICDRRPQLSSLITSLPAALWHGAVSMEKDSWFKHGLLPVHQLEWRPAWIFNKTEDLPCQPGIRSTGMQRPLVQWWCWFRRLDSGVLLCENLCETTTWLLCQVAAASTKMARRRISVIHRLH